MEKLTLESLKNHQSNKLVTSSVAILISIFQRNSSLFLSAIRQSCFKFFNKIEETHTEAENRGLEEFWEN